MQAFCDPLSDRNDFNGLSLDLFKMMARDIGWVAGVDYNFQCRANGTQYIVDLLSNNSDECDIAMASITITSERQLQGVKFAFPYYKGSIGIMVKSEEGVVSGWNWLQPFSPDLWIAIIVTMLVWPAMVFFIELGSLKPRVRKREAVYGVEEATWQSLWTLQHGEGMDVSSAGARVAVMCFAFASLILGSSYTANLAAFLTLRRVSSIDSIFVSEAQDIAQSLAPSCLNDPCIKSPFILI
jgi:hypothetical protein